ncbi:MAG TPA: formyltetrahydrofolate deformylase [Streptosporangiaceae bacterium]|nr:formyltetrahydrofolate deformylase [Streptosporangiaceae bacterium]
MESDVGALVRGPEPRAVRSRPDERYADVGRLVITCPDRPGIVAAVSQFLFEAGANITESQQYSTDPFGGTFFLRLEFHLDGLGLRAGELGDRFAALADRFSMRWKLTRAADLKRVAIMVSRTDHALQEILWRAQSGELHADIRMIISNHTDAGEAAAWWGLPFHHIPVTPETKDAAETAQLRLLAGEIDLVILARYMRILSPRFLSEFTAPIINIHHSFLPAFAGADPYRRAAARGVKLIGATAHYVTAELDAGPIIEQDIVRVDHRCSADDLRRLGRHVERAVLARAVGWHLEDRIIVHQNSTIVFS